MLVTYNFIEGWFEDLKFLDVRPCAAWNVLNLLFLLTYVLIWFVLLIQKTSVSLSRLTDQSCIVSLVWRHTHFCGMI